MSIYAGFVFGASVQGEAEACTSPAFGMYLGSMSGGGSAACYPHYWRENGKVDQTLPYQGYPVYFAYLKKATCSPTTLVLGKQDISQAMREVKRPQGQPGNCKFESHLCCSVF